MPVATSPPAMAACAARRRAESAVIAKYSWATAHSVTPSAVSWPRKPCETM
jgi:hypothetical protein